MKKRLLSWLACPACRSSDLRLDTVKTKTCAAFEGHFNETEIQDGVDVDRKEQQVVIEGAIFCGDCGSVYPVKDGIPRMMVPGSAPGPTSRHADTTVDIARPEWELNFQDLARPLKPNDFLGKLVLDAGCGFGRHTFFAARYGAEVVGMDSSLDGVTAAYRNIAHLARAHVIQADVYNPPFREETFDLAYSFGVMHHLKEPKEAFRTLGLILKPGGRLSLWVYGPRQGVALRMSDLVRGVAADMDPDQLLGLCGAIARGLRVFSHTPYKMLHHLPLARDVVSHLPVHDHHQWAFDVVVADIYDRLRIPVHHWFKGEELERMLTDDGYADIQVSRRVRNNETFRATGIRR